MTKIVIGCAGGAPANNFIRSLRESKRQDYLIGISCSSSDLFLADTNEKYLVAPALDQKFPEQLKSILSLTKPTFLHSQNDFEVRAIARMRNEIEALGVKLYLPSTSTIENCVDKNKSYLIWKKAGLAVPRTLLLKSEQDLKKAFNTLGSTIWIRAIEGGGGQGALPTNNFDFARIWIDHFKGWGHFTAAELLSKDTVTWQSIWYEGELIVAQTRKRHRWNFGNRTLSGVTGITGVGETCADPTIDRLATEAIMSIDPTPHGIFGVDLTYDLNQQPQLTEINIGRFFTTHYFFTKAGLNFPEIYCNIALNKSFPSLTKKINPLPNGLIWIRGMDVEPCLTHRSELEKITNAT